MVRQGFGRAYHRYSDRYFGATETSTESALARTPGSTLPLGIGAAENARAVIDRANGAIRRPDCTLQEVTVRRKLFGMNAIAAARLFPMHMALAHTGGRIHVDATRTTRQACTTATTRRNPIRAAFSWPSEVPRHLADFKSAALARSAIRPHGLIRAVAHRVIYRSRPLSDPARS